MRPYLVVIVHVRQQHVTEAARTEHNNVVKVPLQGDEIGRLIANALEGGIIERRPWYEPAEKLPDQPIISAPLHNEFDTLVVDLPIRNPAGKSP